MICNIRDFGAICSDRLQTTCIQNAIDACFKVGGGEVIIPAGVWRTGGLRLRSNVTLHLLSGALLEASPDPEDYCTYLKDTVEPLTIKEKKDPRYTRSAQWYSRWSNGLIKAVYAENTAVIGDPGSFIDGMNVYDPQGEDTFRGPHIMSFWYCKNIRFEGYTVKNSPNWSHAIFNSENITVKNVSVFGGFDGIDIRCCDHTLVEDCTFNIGDDCIAGFDNIDVTVRNCEFRTACFPIRIGAHGMLVENCHAIGPSGFCSRSEMDEYHRKNSLLSPESKHVTGWGVVYYCDHRAELRQPAGDIIIRNCTFENLLGLFCLPFEVEDRWSINRSLTSIRFENVTAKGVRRPIFIHGDKYEPLTLEMENVTITPQEGYETLPVIVAENYQALRLKNVRAEGFEKPIIYTVSPGEVTAEGGTEMPIKHIGTMMIFYSENGREAR